MLPKVTDEIPVLCYVRACKNTSRNTYMLVGNQMPEELTYHVLRKWPKMATFTKGF